jgi:hypothetical protein
LSAKVLPNRAPGQRRTANAVYFVNGKITEVTTAFPEELRLATLPVRPRGSRRAAEFAYWMPPPFLTQFPRGLEPLVIAKARATVLRASERDFIIPAKSRPFVRKPKRP